MHVNILDFTASTSANVPRQDHPQKAHFGTRGQVLKFGRLSFNQCPGRAWGRGQRRPTADGTGCRCTS